MHLLNILFGCERSTLLVHAINWRIDSCLSYLVNALAIPLSKDGSSLNLCKYYSCYCLTFKSYFCRIGEIAWDEIFLLQNQHVAFLKQNKEY